MWQTVRHYSGILLEILRNTMEILSLNGLISLGRKTNKYLWDDKQVSAF
jgi:hypothetical protein